MKVFTQGIKALTTAIFLSAMLANAKIPVINLGTLNGGSSGASAINNHGEVVGWSRSADGLEQAFYYQNGWLRALETRGRGDCEALAISDEGFVVGSQLTPHWVVYTNLPPLPPTNILIVITNIISPPLTNTGIGRTNTPIIPPIHLNPSNTVVLPLVSSQIPAAQASTTSDLSMAANSTLSLNVERSSGVSMVTNMLYTSRPAWFYQGRLVDLASSANAGSTRGLNAGEMVGEYSFSTNGRMHAFVYQNFLLIDLGTLGGEVSTASAINNRGEVVGWSTISNAPSSPLGVSVFPEEHAFHWRNGIMQDLGTLGGGYSAARAINNQGQIVGFSTTTNGQEHPFLYTQGRMYDLFAMLGGSINTNTSGTAAAINNWGQVVGQISYGYGFHAFFYDDYRMTDLNDLVKLTVMNGPPGFLNLDNAAGINDRDEIVGSGSYWDGAQVVTRAFLISAMAGH